MIDYDKLREAMELAEKYKYNKTSKCAIKHTVSFLEFGGHICEYELILSDGVRRSDSIDSLITVLRKLTETKPLYAVDDVVYHLNDEYQIACMRISEIDLESDEKYYGVDELNDDGGNWWVESQLHPTREALIKAQIEHWHGLLFPEDAKSSCCSVHAGSSEECREFYG